MEKNKLTSAKILKDIELRKSELADYGVKRIGLFGSHLKGGSNTKSDLDFIVSFSKPSFDDYMGLKSMLQHMFGRKVDLVTESALKPALRHIKNEALYARL
jgi:uncharacterized protein